MPIDVGTIAEVQWTRTGGHTVTLTVTKPDGTTINPTPTETTGTFKADVPCEQPGRYVLRWTDTTDSFTYVDTLEVWPEDPRFLISLEDAMDSLKWLGAQRNADGPKLRLYVAAATEVIEDITGAVLQRTVEQIADGGRTGVALWERPSEIVTVTVDGNATTDYIANLNAAIVYAKPAGSRFAPGLQNVVITYRVGGSAIAPSIQLGARELIRHLWQVGQQALTTNPAEMVTLDPRQMSFTRSGFAVPNRVIELIGNHHGLPGTA
ncbi:hypothetical protein JNB63_02120 [Microbacterium trichothecenolyticum]|uniref:hypothetical protein n=1 Tax=Microbacterium trichothecenolyticum TaxID=69370 RepID=UPI001C6EBFC7|nr:hypothetical protein [Microbacterium trichothecenolyticum]MBW9118882.1 hypothetical protein [Microbacterium trichothecenolyticum]